MDWSLVVGLSNHWMSHIDICLSLWLVSPKGCQKKALMLIGKNWRPWIRIRKTMSNNRAWPIFEMPSWGCSETSSLCTTSFPAFSTFLPSWDSVPSCPSTSSTNSGRAALPPRPMLEASALFPRQLDYSYPDLLFLNWSRALDFSPGITFFLASSTLPL